MGRWLEADAFRSGDPMSQHVLQEAVGKIRSMMVLYDRLYRSETHRDALLSDFLPRLFEQIIDILVNELISNSIKYAFAETETPRITILAQRTGDSVTLSYSDNGAGLAESVEIGDTTKEAAGFGMQLIGALAEQIKATVEIKRDFGTRFLSRFNV